MEREYAAGFSQREADKKLMKTKLIFHRLKVNSKLFRGNKKIKRLFCLTVRSTPVIWLS